MQVESNYKLINTDAWSDGQTQSKLWLCRELEKIWTKPNSHFWIYGAWYGTLAQLILQREKLSVQNFQLFDIDTEALEIAKKMNSTWQFQGISEFIYTHADCNLIETSHIQNEKPDLIINTSCEHFENYSWFNHLPSGQKFLVQSNDMQHPTHILNAKSLSHFKEQIGSVSKIYFEGEQVFNYPKNSFKRFMIIGKK